MDYDPHISRQTAAMLRILYKNAPNPVLNVDICRALNLPSSKANPALKNLEQAGWLHRGQRGHFRSYALTSAGLCKAEEYVFVKPRERQEKLKNDPDVQEIVREHELYIMYATGWEQMKNNLPPVGMWVDLFNAGERRSTHNILVAAPLPGFLLQEKGWWWRPSEPRPLRVVPEPDRERLSHLRPPRL